VSLGVFQLRVCVVSHGNDKTYIVVALRYLQYVQHIKLGQVTSNFPTSLEESHDIIEILIDVFTAMSRQDLHLHDLVACGVRDVSVLELGENGAIRYLRTR